MRASTIAVITYPHPPDNKVKIINWYLIIFYWRNWSGHHSNYSPFTSFYPSHAPCSLSTSNKYHGSNLSKKDPQSKFLASRGEGGKVVLIKAGEGGASRKESAGEEKKRSAQAAHPPAKVPSQKLSLLNLLLHLTLQYLSLLKNNLPLLLTL